MCPTPWSGHSQRSASAAFRRRWRFASRTACSAVLLVLTACGGAEPKREALPADVGAELAEAAADVTEALEAGEPEAARAEADELLAAVAAVLARGDVPRALADEVRLGAERLAALVETAQPPPPPAPPAPEPPPEGDGDEDEDDDDDDDDDDRGKGKKKGKNKEKNGDDD